jgi:hypothetical protein
MAKCDFPTPLRVRIVVVPIEPKIKGVMMRDGIGQIRAELQAKGIGEIAAARERKVGRLGG